MPPVAVTEEPIGVNQADGSPIGCTLCHAQTGPFVIVQTARFVVQTNAGPVPVEEPLVLCAPKIEHGTIIRRGCAGDIATGIGFHDPLTLEHSQDAQRQALDRVAELEEQVAKLKDSQMPVVPVEELMKLIEATGGGGR